MAIQKAVASGGTMVERLERALTAVMEAMNAHSTLCTEMPRAVNDAAKYESLMGDAQRLMIGPLRDLLIEGKAAGELVWDDVDLTASHFSAPRTWLGGHGRDH